MTNDGSFAAYDARFASDEALVTLLLS